MLHIEPPVVIPAWEPGARTFLKEEHIANELPPILRGSGLRLEAIGQSAHGYPFVRFVSEDDDDDVRSVVVYLTTANPTKLLYGYSLWDPSTRSLRSYHGEFGDPELDTLGDIDAI